MELLQGENHVAHNFTSHVTKLCMKHKFSNTGHYFVECWKIRPVKPDCKNMLACQQSEHGSAYECVWSVASKLESGVASDLRPKPS